MHSITFRDENKDFFDALSKNDSLGFDLTMQRIAQKPAPNVFELINA